MYEWHIINAVESHMWIKHKWIVFWIDNLLFGNGFVMLNYFLYYSPFEYSNPMRPWMMFKILFHHVMGCNPLIYYPFDVLSCGFIVVIVADARKLWLMGTEMLVRRRKRFFAEESVVSLIRDLILGYLSCVTAEDAGEEWRAINVGKCNSEYILCNHQIKCIHSAGNCLIVPITYNYSHWSAVVLLNNRHHTIALYIAEVQQTPPFGEEQLQSIRMCCPLTRK